MEDEDIEILIKFFYMTYQRIAEYKICLSLNPKKIFPLHHNLIEKKGIGLLHRALFTNQKKYNKRRYKERPKEEIFKEVKNYKEKINKEFSKINNQISDLDKKTFFIEQNINYSSALKKYFKAEKEIPPSPPDFFGFLL